MVLFFEWHQIAVEPKSSSCLSMTGEDTGLEALASPLAGYLGKVQERAASLDSCPWCTSKGFTYALHSYCINLQESITLCTNPQCLFPLVTQPLEDVLASLEPVGPVVGNKRKHASNLGKEEAIQSPLKLRRLSEVGDLDSPVKPLELGSVSPVTNGLHSTPKAVEKVNGYHKDCPEAETAGWDSLQHKDVSDGDASADDHATSLASSRHSSQDFFNNDGADSALSHHLCANGVSEMIKQKNVPVLNGCSRLGSSQDRYPNNIKAPSTSCSEQTKAKEETLIGDSPTNVDTACIHSEDKDLFCTSLEQPEKLVSVPKRLLWRNTDNLCWLDSLLAALVNCKNVSKCKPKDEPPCLSVWQLMRGYEEICAAVEVHHQTGPDGVVEVPSHVLQKANIDLQSLRMSVFKLLQPKLQCKLGQMETPVFAMPLLLTSDSRVEHLFQSTFQWEFRCSECNVITKERVIKTLPTFTNIVPDWRPLNAGHYSPCNMCGKKNQMRRMFLESLSPVFALHFVEGLPDNDVSIYTFTFRRKLYSVSTLIQYSHQLKHFVTWIRNEDGSWLEYDDLKHPDFKIHQNLQVPAHEMHVVFWEAEEAADPSPSAPEKEGSLNDMTVEPLLDQTSDQSFPTLHNDTDLICALTEEDSSNAMDATVTAGVDTSIGDRTLLNTFEGLSHKEIITLTLVEVDQALPHQTEDMSPPTRTERLDPSPDGSLSAAGGSVCHGADVGLLTTLNSSNTESVDISSSDAMSVPSAERRRGRTGQETTVSSQRGEKAVPQTPPPTPSELPKEVCHTPAQDEEPPVEVTQQASPESSTDTISLSASQKSIPLDQNARWSFLLSKHPLNHFHKSVTKPTPTQTLSSVPEVKPSHPLHSTNPIKRQMIPSILPKPQLITEEGLGLPPKAAEMYCGFSTKNSTNHSPLPSPLPNGNSKLFQTISSDYLAPPMVTSGMLPPFPGAKLLPEVCSSKKHGSYSSMVPPGLGKTEALRYKLLKKLKAKKKKLARLNQLLGKQEGACLRPDSTDLTSPSTVTSSTYDDDFLSDLLSPATTASNLSPDSTGFLEMLANGQDGADDVNGVVNAAGVVSQSNGAVNGPENENFLEDFLMQCGFETN